MIIRDDIRSLARRTAGVLVLFVAAGAPAAAQHWFEALSIPTSTAGASTRAVADVDGDGDLDAVRLTMGSGQAVVALNDGTGAWTELAPFVLANPSTVAPAVADVDGDGTVDLVIGAGNGTTAVVDVYRGLGGGTFAAPVATPLGLAGIVLYLETGDVDGDAFADFAALVISSGGPPAGSATLLWLRGTGGGSLQAQPASSWTASAIADVAVLDYTGDGTPDVLIATSNVGLFAFPTAAAALLPPITVVAPAGFSPFAYLGRLLVGDVEGDGDLDLVGTAFLFPWTVIQAYLNAGGGTWLVPAPTNAMLTPLTALDLGDMDADGFADLAGMATNGASSFLRGDGSGGFVPVFTFMAPGITPGFAPFGAVADLDQDGAGDYAGATFTWFGASALGDPAAATLPAAPVLATDFDDDGDQDVLTASDLLVNDSTGSLLGTGGVPPPPLGYFVAGWTAADLDGDGFADLVVGITPNTFPFQVPGAIAQNRWYRSNGDGTFTDAGMVYPAGAALTVLAGDVDADGDEDTVTTGAGLSALFLNDGTGAQSFALLLPAGRTPRRLADADGDGDLYVFTVDLNLGFALLLNQATGFTVEPFTGGLSATGHDGIAVGDLDGDGDPDVVGTSGPPNARTYAVFANQGGTFVFDNAGTLPGSSAGLFDVRAVDLLEVNGDGVRDVALRATFSSLGSVAAVLPSTGAGLTFGPSRAFAVQGFAAVADVDTDGDRDLVGLRIARNRRNLPATSGGALQFGAGTPGTGGFAPLLGATGPFSAGSFSTLRLRHGLGGAPALIAVGPAPAALANQPLPGLTLYVDPIAALLPITLSGPPGQAGAGSFDLGAVLPPGLANLTAVWQAAILDPQGPSGLTMTNGVDVLYR